MTKKSLMFTVAFATFVSGCTTNMPALEGQLDPSLGHAVKANIDAQFVTPTDKQKADTFIPADPTLAALARKNYEQNTVPIPN